MADSQTIVRTAAGLYPHPNNPPAGSLIQAENAVIDREGIISNRRGFNRYGTVLTNPPSGLFEFKKTLVVKDGSTLKYDNSGTWTSWSGTYSPPETGARIHSLEANNSFYLTTSLGVYKQASLTGTPCPAGMPMALDTTLALYSTSGFLANTKAVAYRVVWGRTDANNCLILGAPGSLTWILNDSGGARQVQITMTVPPNVVSGDFAEVYRTEVEDSVALLQDRTYKVRRVPYTSGTTLTWIDNEDTLSEDCYTNDLQETISQANYTPPWCKYMASYKGHIFFGDILREQEVNINLVDASLLTYPSPQSTVTITVGAQVLAYNAAAAENTATHAFQKFTAGTAEENVRNTALSLCRCINLDTTNTTVLAYYTSTLDDPAGKMLIKARGYSTTAIVVTGTNVTGCFDPELSTSPTSVIQREYHKIARSKYQKPEAVPYLNTMEIGSANKAILGLASLKNGLLVWKEDGIFIISGETDGGGGFNFLVDEVDPSIKLLCPDSLVVLDNAVFGYTTQGVIRCYEGGSGIVSRAIELVLNPISAYQNFGTITYAVSYESDRKYLLFTQDTNQDTITRVCWVYNYLTNAWCMWRKDISCGIVLSSDQKLYLGHATDTYVLQERKSYSSSNEDHQDESFDTTVTATGTTTWDDATVSTVTLGYTYTGTDLTTGWLFKYGHYEGLVRAVTNLGGGSYTLTLSDQLVLPATPFTATLTMPIDLWVEWVPDDAGNPGVMKQFSMAQIYLEEDQALYNDIAFQADTQYVREWVETTKLRRYRGWGSSPWGSAAWGDELAGTATPLRVAVPRNHQRCRALKITYNHCQAKERVDILQLTLDVRSYGSRTMKETS